MSGRKSILVKRLILATKTTARLGQGFSRYHLYGDGIFYGTLNNGPHQILDRFTRSRHLHLRSCACDYSCGQGRRFAADHEVGRLMARRAATITQADISRVLRASGFGAHAAHARRFNLIRANRAR
jgi:hypothetical protein